MRSYLLKKHLSAVFLLGLIFRPEGKNLKTIPIQEHRQGTESELIPNSVISKIGLTQDDLSQSFAILCFWYMPFLILHFSLYFSRPWLYFETIITDSLPISLILQDFVQIYSFPKCFLVVSPWISCVPFSVSLGPCINIYVGHKHLP